MFPSRGAQFNDRRVQFQYAEITYTIVMDGFFRVPVDRGMQTVQTVVGSDVFACDMEDVKHWDVVDIGLNIGHYRR